MMVFQLPHIVGSFSAECATMLYKISSERAKESGLLVGRRSRRGFFLGTVTLIALAFLSTTNLIGATYYIDYSAGSDAKSGLSTAEAWQRHPFMKGFLGKYTHTAGDRFIFKGGVSWPNVCFPLSITAGGASASSVDYYGTTNSWYSGVSFNRPIFSGGGSAISGSGNQLEIIGLSPQFITIDNIEFDAFYWSTRRYANNCVFFANGRPSITVQNCYFHNWTHSGTVDSDVLSEAGAGSVVTNCVFDGSPNGKDSMVAVHSFYRVVNCQMMNMANGIVIGSLPGEIATIEVTGNRIGPINDSFDLNMHENGIEVMGDASVSIVASNYVHDATAVAIYANTRTAYVFNNVVWSFSDNQCLLTDPFPNGNNTNYFYNNTFAGSVGGIRVVGKTGTVGKTVIKNNHFIGGTPVTVQVSVKDLSSAQNVTNTAAVATSFGYTAANLFQPTSSTAPTVAKGVDLSFLFGTDISGKPRRTLWDAGAYQFADVPEPVLTMKVTPASHDFGTLALGTTASKVFSLSNSSSSLISGKVSVSAAPFTVLNGGTYTLNPGQTQSLTLAFSPTSVGSISGLLTFSGVSGTTVSLSGSATNPAPPILATISQDVPDVDNFTSGIQVTAGSNVKYSSSASDPNGRPVSWQWVYSVNGGPDNVLTSGTGTVSSVSYTYPQNSSGSTYLWKLIANNGFTTAQKTITVYVLAASVGQSAATFLATSGSLTAPIQSVENYIYQNTEVTDPNLGGRATYNFYVASNGRYVVQAFVDAPSSSANSFFVSVDTEPENPGSIWDIPVTTGFEERVVSWRGNGTVDQSQYSPMVFLLSKGTHKLIFVGREASVKLQSIKLSALPPAPQALRVAKLP